MFPSLLFAIIGFLIGGILFSYHVPKRLNNVDVVALSADHNPGTSNAMKLCGVRVGLACLALDLLKGYLPIRMALRMLSINDPWFALVMIGPVLGHALAVFYPFRGGKAVAVSFGVLLGLLPFSFAVLALALPYVFFSTIVVLNPHERRSVVSFFCLAVMCLIGGLYTHRYSIPMGTTGISMIAMWKNHAKDDERVRAAQALTEK